MATVISTWTEGSSYNGAMGSPQHTSPLAAIRHIDLCVSDLEASLKFYGELLALLGWLVEQAEEIVGERGERVIYLPSRGGFGEGALGLRQAQSPSPAPDRYSVGLHHLAFNASSREQVEEVWKWIRENKIENEGPPADYYGAPYHAVFLRDPDGLKLEVVHRTR